MSLITLLAVLSAFGIPALLIWGAEYRRAILVAPWQRRMLYLGGLLAFLLFEGFENGEWMGLRNVLEAVWPEVMVAGLVALLLLGSGTRPQPESYHPEPTGRRSPT